jgi:hypothetical protein
MEVQIIRSQKDRGRSGSAAIAKSIGIGKPQIGGSWNLIDTNGKPFGSADL